MEWSHREATIRAYIRQASAGGFRLAIYTLEKTGRFAFHGTSHASVENAIAVAEKAISASAAELGL